MQAQSRAIPITPCSFSDATLFHLRSHPVSSETAPDLGSHWNLFPVAAIFLLKEFPVFDRILSIKLTMAMRTSIPTVGFRSGPDSGPMPRRFCGRLPMRPTLAERFRDASPMRLTLAERFRDASPQRLPLVERFRDASPQGLPLAEWFRDASPHRLSLAERFRDAQQQRLPLAGRFRARSLHSLPTRP
jgi:hypothetical protein